MTTSYFICEVIKDIISWRKLIGATYIQRAPHIYRVAYNCTNGDVSIKHLHNGVLVAMDDDFDEDAFKAVLTPFLLLVGEEIERDRKYCQDLEERLRIDAKREQEAEDMRNTNQYLNDTFGQY